MYIHDLFPFLPGGNDWYFMSEMATCHFTSAPNLPTWGICCNNTMINLESCVVNCFYRPTGLYASFLKRQGHQSIFSLVKRTLWGNCKSVLDHFKGTKAMTRGIEAIAFVASVKYQAWIYSWLCIWLHLWSNFTKRRRQIITCNISLIILCVGHTRKNKLLSKLFLILALNLILGQEIRQREKICPLW